MNALLEIRIGYGVKLDARARALLTEASVSAVEFDETGEVVSWKAQPIVTVDALAQLKALLPANAEVSVLRVIGNSSTAALERFGQRNTTIENTRCNVAVAGLGLLTVDEVTHECDCCTDRLQSLLAEGWRILAVCVQPDQRRPDYILGRTSNVAERAPRKAERDAPRPMPAPPERVEIELPPATTQQMRPLYDAALSAVMPGPEVPRPRVRHPAEAPAPTTVSAVPAQDYDANDIPF